MFVGEAPGEKEDLSGIPFVGAAGKLLDKYLCAVGINRENVYIANILKCRPPHNRDPKPEEEDECIGFLREQVRLIQPRVIVCLGRISAMRLIKPDFRITKEHGIFYKKRKIHNLRRVPPGGAPARSAQTRGYAHGYEEYKGASRRKDRNGGNCAIANVPVAKAAGGCYNEHRTQNGYNVKR